MNRPRFVVTAEEAEMALIGRPNHGNYSCSSWKCLLELVSYRYRNGG